MSNPFLFWFELLFLYSILFLFVTVTPYRVYFPDYPTITTDSLGCQELTLSTDREVKIQRSG